MLTVVATTLLLLALQSTNLVDACSDILVTPGASSDGSAMIAYNADDVSLFGYLYHYPATRGKGTESLDVYEWDSGVRQTRVLAAFSFLHM